MRQVHCVVNCSASYRGTLTSLKLIISSIGRGMGSASLSPAHEVTFQNQQYVVLKEGLAEILTPSQAKEGVSKAGKGRQNVFYNPVQQYNRDLSVVAIRSFAHDFAFVQQERKAKRAYLAKRGQKRKRDAAIEDVAIATDGGVTLPGEPAKAAGSSSAKKEPEASNEGEGGVRVEGNEVQVGPEAHPFGFNGSFKILDALSATGLRALRYAKEIPMASQIVANDMSATATAAIQRNAEYNSVVSKIQVSTADAVDHMHHASSSACRNRNVTASSHYHVIDLDPYGTAAPFFDSAIRALVDGGLLCVTCTDAGVFASSGYLEKTYSQYGGLPMDGPPAHEGGLRLIVNSVATAAARYGIAIEPLLSLSIDFYARIFIRIHRSPAEVKLLASKTMFVHNCDKGCGAWTIQNLAHAKEKANKNGDTVFHFRAAQGPSASSDCPHCGFKTHVAGPMWGGPLHNPHFIKHVLSSLPALDAKTYPTLDRMEGMLTLALNECVDLPNTASVSTSTTAIGTDGDTQTRPIPPLPPQLRTSYPFFIQPSSLAKVIHTSTPSEAQLRGALLHAGYKASRSHTKAGSITTNAPWAVIWHIMREWARQRCPPKDTTLKPSSAGWGIMNRKPTIPKKASSPANGSEDPIDRHQQAENAAHMVDEAAVVSEARAAISKVRAQDNDTALEDVIPFLKVALERAYKAADQVQEQKFPEVVFDEPLGKRGLKDRGVVFYAQHPPNWGPGKRAGA